MESSTYKTGYSGAKETVRLQRYAILVQALVILLLTWFVLGERERLVLVPPVMNERMEVAYDSANANYYKSYALYVASFVGNVNPGNATFVREGLSLVFTPDLYTQMQAKIAKDAQTMRVSGRSLRFYADRVEFEPKTGKTFVAGKQEIVSATGNVHDQDITYELTVVIKDGMPKVSNFAQYQGAPRTEKWLERNSHKVDVASADSR